MACKLEKSIEQGIAWLEDRIEYFNRTESAEIAGKYSRALEKNIASLRALQVKNERLNVAKANMGGAEVAIQPTAEVESTTTEAPTIDYTGYAKELINFIKSKKNVSVKLDIGKATEYLKGGPLATTFSSEGRIVYPDFKGFLANKFAVKNVMNETKETEAQVRDRAEQAMNGFFLQMAKVHEHIHIGAVEFMKANPSDTKTKYVNKLYKQLLEKAKANKELDGIQGGYWKTDVDEFLAVALSNPDMITYLNSVKSGETTLLHKLVGRLMQMVGMVKGSANEVLVDSLLKMVEENVVVGTKSNNRALHIRDAYKARQVDEVKQLAVVADGIEPGALPTKYLSMLDNIVKEIVKPKITNDEFLLFSQSSLESLVPILGQHSAKKNTVTMAELNARSAEEQAQIMLEDYYGKVAFPELEQYSEEFVEAVMADERIQELVAANKNTQAEKLLKLFAETKGLHGLSHELVHAGASSFMDANPKHELTVQMNELYEEALEQAEEIDFHLAAYPNSGYWKTNVDEFLAEALTNPQLVIALQNAKTMKAGRKYSANLFKRVFDIAMKMLGFAKDGSLYSHVLDTYVSMLENQVDTDEGTAKTVDEVSQNIMNQILQNTKDC